MYPLIYNKATIVARSSVIRRSYNHKPWFNYNHALIRSTAVVIKRKEFKDVPRSIEPALSNFYFLGKPDIQIRHFHVSPSWKGQEASSKVEETVKNLKEQQVEKEKKTTTPPKDVVEAPEKAVVEKRTMWQKVKAEMLHYYHGFRLLGLDMKVSAKLIWRILHGHELSRREHRLLVKTTGDMFRLIPFSVFIIVPFMEFLLPVAIKLFPGMLPSTFQTSSEKEDKLKQALKVKIEMAKFLQKTLDDMAVQSTDRKSEKAKEFAEFFYKLRTTGAEATNEEIMKFSKLFEDEITLDSISRQQLIALCRVLDVQTIGTTNFIRFLLRMKLRSLAADDRLIEKEGVDSLTRAELQQACRARGMRAYGMPENRLRMQLEQWLDLSLNKKVPPSLLLLSRALMVSETIPMSDKLKATISALPDDVLAQTKGAIGEKEGKVDHRTKIEIIKMEERRIEEERREKKDVEPKPATPVREDKKDEITMSDVKVLEQALDSVGKENKKMAVEKEELKELREELAEYQEDIKELNKIKADAKGETEIEGIKVSKGANLLYKKVNKMIGKMDAVLKELEHSEKEVKKKVEALASDKKTDSKEVAKEVAELVRIDELIAAIKQIQSVPDDSRLKRITEILGKIDDDRDGSIKIEDVLKVVELIGKEEIKLNKKQLGELIELMDKEEVLEVEEQIQKALQKEEKEAKDNKSDEAASPVLIAPEKSESKTELKSTDKGTKRDTNAAASAKPSLEKSRNSATTVAKSTDNSDSVQESSITSNVPPTPKKKAEGSKQL